MNRVLPDHGAEKVRFDPLFQGCLDRFLKKKCQPPIQGVSEISTVPLKYFEWLSKCGLGNSTTIWMPNPLPLSPIQKRKHFFNTRECSAKMPQLWHSIQKYVSKSGNFNASALLAIII
jgi:hypothetical protein